MKRFNAMESSSQKQTFHLCESVNAWMTSLRHKTDNYCIYGQHDNPYNILVYQIKSIAHHHNDNNNYNKSLAYMLEKYHLICDMRILAKLLRPPNVEDDKSQILLELTATPAPTPTPQSIKFQTEFIQMGHLTYLNLDNFYVNKNNNNNITNKKQQPRMW